MTTLYPLPTPPTFEVDFSRLLLDVTSQVQQMRVRRRQPPLVPNGVILFGQESLSELESAPAIHVVPRGFVYKHARETANQDFDPRRLFSQWMQLECHCWGDDNPDRITDTLYAFSTATELARELLVAFCDNNFGPHSVDVTASQFIQKTDQNRQGRTLILHVELETFVARDPPWLGPIATTPGGPGISVGATVYAQSQDGTSTVGEATFTIP